MAELIDLSELEKFQGYEIVKSTTEPTFRYRVRVWKNKGDGIAGYREWGKTLQEAITDTLSRANNG
jgi:hypothetical protein